MDLTNKSELIHYLQSHGLYTKKGLGQNFLIDRAALEKIVDAADLSKKDTVIEVGPGLGVLTEELVRQSGNVIAVELDDKLAHLLGEKFAVAVISSDTGLPGEPRNPSIKKGSLRFGRDDNSSSPLEVINSDILQVNLKEIVGDSPYKVVANIPYYITSKILRYFLEQENKPESIVLLTQKEVAERICARPGDMSVLSVSVQAYGKPEIVGIVKASLFFPAPKVDSAILRIKDIHPLSCHSGLDPESIQLDPRVKPEDDSKWEKEFFRTVNIGFSSRRKTLLNNLSAGYHLDKNKVLDILKEAGLDENTRAQELSIEQWGKLSKATRQ